MGQNEDFVSEFISHHGIKGMKWGIRNSRRGVDVAKKAIPSKAHEEHLTSKKLRSKRVSQLSNEEIKRANERANLESQFSRNNPGKIQKGHNHVKTIMGVAGTASTVYAFGKSPLGQKLLGQTMKKAGKKVVIKAGESFI